MKIFVYTLMLLIGSTSTLFGQLNSSLSESEVTPAFGSWSVYTSHRDIVDILPIAVGSREYLAVQTTGGLLIYDQNGGQVTVFNRGDGKYQSMASAMAVNEQNGEIWFGYSDGMLSVLDLATMRFRNYNDISRNDRFLSNAINDLKIDNGMLYAATDFGVVLFELNSRTVIDSYSRFGSLPSPISVRTIDVDNGNVYLGTISGIAIGNLSDGDLKLASGWLVYNQSNGFTNEPVDFIIGFEIGGQQTIYASTLTTNYRFDGNSWSTITNFGTNGIRSIYKDNDTNWTISTTQRLYTYNPLNRSTSLFSTAIQSLTYSAFIRTNTGFYAGTNIFGLSFWSDENADPDYYQPNGPSHNLFQQFVIGANGDVIGASSPTPGRFNIGFRDTGFYIFNDGNWVNYNMNSGESATPFTGDSFNTAAVSGDQYFFGSWGRGIFRLDRSTGEIVVYNTQNSNLIGISEASSFYVNTGLTADVTNDDHIWAVSWSGVSQSLSRFSIENDTWTNFDKLSQIPGDARYRDVFVDSYGQLWITLLNPSEAGRGVLVVQNPEGGDDSAFRLSTSEEAGNLPNDRINAIIQDRRGEVWLGTDQGIARLLFPDRIVTGTSLERRSQPLINADTSAFNRILIRNVRVTAMAVDANNQKWVGSDGDGLYLIEESGRRVIRHFTTSNSPLTSNVINSLALNSETGQLHIATENGFAVYQALEQEGESDMQRLRIYPNPYSYQRDGNSPIIIESLADNSTVSVVSVDGRLVRRFVTRGGRAQWDGLDDAGNQAATGVYFITATGNNNDQVARGRIVLVR